MIALPPLRFACLGGCLALAALSAHADTDTRATANANTNATTDTDCRIAFDVGSSGIRVGASNSTHTARRNIDYLSPLWAGRGLQEVIQPTSNALRQLPVQAGLEAHCQRVAGGFSAWRLAWEQSPAHTVAALEQIYADSGVALLVVPQAVEGSYGYSAAQQKLGPRLQTSHILDVGGGSLQIAGAQRSYGKALGQKFWHRLLCQHLRPEATAPCTLQPLTAPELAQARQLLQTQLQDLPAALPTSMSMTAISRPITQGVQQAVQRLQADAASGDSTVLERRHLSAAIEQLAPATLSATVQQTGAAMPYAGYLLSDMLLTEGLLQASASQSLHLVEIKVANVPGILADDQAFSWATRYPCYLQRLQAQGPSAYFSDPHSCSAAPSPTKPLQPLLSPTAIPAGENPVFWPGTH